MQWKTRPLGYFSYTVLCCLCKRGDLWPPASAGLSQISIHAPARGATQLKRRQTVRERKFQFTPLREGRPAVKGRRRAARANFNSRPCERGDCQQLSGCCSTPTHFNSRPCERGDQCATSRLPSWGYFNTRPCERGDRLAAGKRRRRAISIHAPARGATPPNALIVRVCMQFQFTPLREGRQQN